MWFLWRIESCNVSILGQTALCEVQNGTQDLIKRLSKLALRKLSPDFKVKQVLLLQNDKKTCLKNSARLHLLCIYNFWRLTAWPCRCISECSVTTKIRLVKWGARIVARFLPQCTLHQLKLFWQPRRLHSYTVKLQYTWGRLKPPNLI